MNIQAINFIPITLNDCKTAAMSLLTVKSELNKGLKFRFLFFDFSN